MAHYKEKAVARVLARFDAQGGFYDLNAILVYLNAKYFSGRVRAQITWEILSLPGRSDLLTGTYTFEDRLIKIHPALDHKSVPRFFLESVIFHEMLHQLIPPVRLRLGRRVVSVYHHSEFLRAERRFPHYHLAQQWERRNAGRLYGRMKKASS